jgi:hypothetical protein
VWCGALPVGRAAADHDSLPLRRLQEDVGRQQSFGVITAPREAFHHLSGEVARFRRTADSGRQSDVVRCAACGTRLWHEPQSFPIVTLATGTLDDPSWVVPATHIWIEKAMPGTLMHEDAVKLEGQPARDVQIAAFRSLYGDGA